MKERPILFNTEMVKAILEGSKTVTRRPVKIYTQHTGCYSQYNIDGKAGVQFFGRKGHEEERSTCQFGQIGDRLWVREPAKVIQFQHDDMDWPPYIWYSFSDKKGGNTRLPNRFFNRNGKRLPSWVEKLHGVPNGCIKEMARIWLEITDIRVERVQGITEDQALKDGGWEYKNCPYHKAPIKSFQNLWGSIYKNWDKNPWVWVVEFKVIKQ